MLRRILLSGAALTAFTAIAAAQTPPQPAEPSTPPAAQQPMSPGAGGSGMASQAETADPNLYSTVQGADVIGQNDEKLGTVADLLLDKSGTLKAMVLGHGGIVGIGQTYRHYEVSELPAVSDGKITLGQINTAALEGMPEYQYPEAETGRAATDTAAPPAGGGGSAMSPPASAPAEPAAPTAGADLWPASYLVGANITNAEESAEIKDLRFEGNRVAAVQIDKGALGLGTDVTEVKFEDLDISGTPAEPKIALKAGAPGLATEQPSSGSGASAPPAAGSPPAESAPSSPSPAPAPSPSPSPAQ